MRRLKVLRWIIVFAIALSSILLSSHLINRTHFIQITKATLQSDRQVSSDRPPRLDVSIGTNLAGLTDWSTELPFLDAFKTSRPWIPQRNGVWDTGEYSQLNLDKNGWVKSLPAPADDSQYNAVGTLMLRDIGASYPGGNYVVLYDGEGKIEYGFAAQKDVTASKPGRDVINVTPTHEGGIYLKITETDPQQNGNYIRNIHVVPIAYEGTYGIEIFNPNFIKKLEPFGTFRFMDWMETNNSTQSNWNNRPTQMTASFQGMGASVETMVALANKTLSNPWFTLPHMATDDYITKFAQYVKANLAPTLKIYVEYSNEVWNGMFGQGTWIEQQGQQAWPNSSESSYTKRMNWYGKRTSQICDLWKGVFGKQSKRVICILGAQAANPWTATEALDCPLWQGSPCQGHGIDALAIAPYFGGYLGDKKNEPQVQNWTVDELFQEINQGGVLIDGPPGGAVQQATEWIEKNFKVASQRHLNLVAYEGGQHLVGHESVENNQIITNLFIAANRDKGMYDAYLTYLNQWKNSGGTLFMNFSDIGSSSQWGSWGVLESVNQPSSPKYKALKYFVDTIDLSSTLSHY
jgi:hypothetical protein